MTGWESSAWPLGAGSAMIFMLSVVLSGASWLAAFAAIAATVAAWSLRAPVAAGAALAIIAWSLLTGFDVNSRGELRFTGWADVVRLGVLIGAALAAAALGHLTARSYGQDGLERDEDEELIWAAPHRQVEEWPLGVTPEPAALRQVPRIHGLNGTVR